MLKWINVKELVRLDLDESKSLGIMRLDWSGSRSGIHHNSLMKL